MLLSSGQIGDEEDWGSVGWVGERDKGEACWGPVWGWECQVGGSGYPEYLGTPSPGQQLWGPGSVAGCAPTLSPPSQYTASLEQELPNLKVDLENVDLLSPAGHRDLQALQSSGLGGLQYPGFLLQVSSGSPGQTTAEQARRGAGGASHLVLALCLPLAPPHVPGPCPQTTCPRPVLGTPILMEWSECVPIPSVLLGEP